MVNSDFGKLFRSTAKQNGATESLLSPSTLAPSTRDEAQPQQSSTQASTNKVERADSSLNPEGVSEREESNSKALVREESIKKEENGALVDCGTNTSAVSTAAAPKGGDARKVPGNNIATQCMSTAL